jgi:DNA modification methylase
MENNIFYQSENGILYNGESLSILRNIPAESINCCVTSPPYYGLRDYGTAQWEGGNANCDHIEKNARNDSGQNEFLSGRQEPDKIQYRDVCSKCGARRVDKQIGLEQTYDDYINNLCDIFDEVKRVIRKDGTCWVNIGDSYSTSHETGATDAQKGWKSGEMGGVRQKSHGRANGGDIPNKSLMGIPFRFALEMINRGWILRNTIIWHKPSCMPQSASDRFTVDFEYIFFFVKNKKYWFDTQYEPYSESYLNDLRHKNGVPEHNSWKDYKSQGVQSPTSINDNSFGKLGDGRIKRTVWQEQSKYEDEEMESTYRQGMHKGRGDGLVEKRNLPSQKEFVDTIRERYTVDQLVEKTGIAKSTIEHWFRYDDSGFSFPSAEDWKKVETDLFPELCKVYYEPDDVKSSYNGRIKRTVWSINTKPFKEAHFATYPTELIRTPIAAGCPEFICSQCGKPRERIIKTIPNPERSHEGRTHTTEEHRMGKSPVPEKGWMTEKVDEGWLDCGCASPQFIGGVVLDPFFGSGTTAIEAENQHKGWVGIELNPKYCAIAKRRLQKSSQEMELF